MRSFFRVFLFLMAFQLEVRVRASAAPVMEMPQHCLSRQTACSVKAVNSSFHWQSGDVQLHATQGSVLERENSQTWKLIHGALWVEKAPQVAVETLYATIRAARGEYWVVQQKEKIWVRNVSAALNVQLRDGTKLELPAGFQFWVSGINSQSKSEYGMIEPIDLKEHVKIWYTLYPGDKESFKKQVALIKENWGDLVEKSSAIYQQQTLRKMAAIEDEKQKQHAKAEHARREKERVRTLYMQRVFER